MKSLVFIIFLLGATVVNGQLIFGGCIDGKGNNIPCPLTIKPVQDSISIPCKHTWVAAEVDTLHLNSIAQSVTLEYRVPPPLELGKLLVCIKCHAEKQQVIHNRSSLLFPSEIERARGYFRGDPPSIDSLDWFYLEDGKWKVMQDEKKVKNGGKKN